jgi:hypothetical protein
MTIDIEHPTPAPQRVKRQKRGAGTHVFRLARFKARELAWKANQAANRVEWFNEPSGTEGTPDEAGPVGGPIE